MRWVTCHLSYKSLQTTKSLIRLPVTQTLVVTGHSCFQTPRALGRNSFRRKKNHGGLVTTVPTMCTTMVVSSRYEGMRCHDDRRCTDDTTGARWFDVAGLWILASTHGSSWESEWPLGAEPIWGALHPWWYWRILTNVDEQTWWC